MYMSKIDKLQLRCGDLVFDKKKRGRPSHNRSVAIPEEFSRRECAGNVAGIFDLRGNAAPIVGGLKLKLRKLNMRKLHWDDVIPEDLRQIWTSNFEMIKELANVTFKRCVIPTDALNLDIETLEFGDASDSLICAAVYVRVKRTNGQYSCQLLFARTKLLPLGTTTPRGELAAAELNATTGFVVRRSLGEYHKGYHKFTDSQIALCWINCLEKPLKQWPRARVIEINRLSSKKRWWFIPGPKNIADIGTREGVQIKDVQEGSEWQEGYEWMRKDEKEFPMMSVECISLASIRDQVNAEMHKNGPILEAIEVMYSEPAQDLVPATFLTLSKLVPESVGERYKFSKYLIDPNKHRLRHVVRVMAMVMRFIKNTRAAVLKHKHQVNLGEAEIRKCLKVIPEGLSEQCENDAITLSDTELMLALEYFYRKATQEIKEFRDRRDYSNISEETDGILYYKGRILLEQCVTGVKDMCDVMVDLSCRTFWVPLVDASSPLAYCIANEVHWHSKEARHTGVEKTLRYTLQYAHILEGRELLTKIRKSCRKCRALLKEQLKVVMGPVSKHNLNIAPAFYVTQVDLVGPFESYHGANKRTKLKIWAIVFCCATTGAIDLKVMESYTATAFILGFKRFSSRSGFPKLLLPDQGSQLLKGCADAKLTFRDIKSQLNTEYGVEFSPCPVGAHYMHGRVERKIRHIRESLERSLTGRKLSTIGWETVFAEIANSINDLPIGLASRNVDLGNLDLLTPNRLLLGRNNDRSPVEPVEVTGSYDRVIDANNDIFKIWFKCWLTEYVPNLMKQQKWFKGDRELAVGDIVLFKKAEKELECHYKYGMIKELKRSKDDIARSAIVEYQNAEESVRRTTLRGIRELILIQHVGEMGIMEELDNAAKEGEV